jgi:hypothetical protein
LIMAIDVDLGSELTTRWRCIKWPDIKPHKIRSVASRSRRVMIIFNKIFICQFEPYSLYSISHINETKPTRNPSGLLEVRWFGRSRFQNATGKNVDIMFSDTMTLCVHSGNDQPHLAPDSARYSRPSAPGRSVGYYGS